ncbi:hypothetical protein SteCoe_19308 [Stentor coeruleus]|uniref:Condensin complex subunit 1 C-terminal domain-containing protein n=1 Tax=Stentor coeruleus TaxID=5963 RepID=A0A1R2BUL9_9CILI|nr:hypothetical protein SteCoe_19308 [Stentor coeruleus]
MKFHSEWLLDDPIEVMTDLEKSLHSKDEIENLSTSEFFTDIDKALYLIDKGQLSQKLWVVRAISSYMHQSGSEQVLAELIDRLPYWNEPAQEEAGKAFITVLSSNFFPIKYYENLLLLILQILETETWSLQETWGEAFAELAKRYCKRSQTEAFILSAFHQTDNIRSIGGYVLSACVEAQIRENCEDLLRKIYSMTQDPSSLVRKNMCKALKNLMKILPKKQIESQVVPETLKLVEDDSAEVLESALPLFCELMDYCSYSCKENIIEILKYSFFTAQNNKLSQVKLKYFGKIMVSLRLCMDEEFREICIKWYIGFDNVKENDIRPLMAYNFPALLYIIGSMNDQLLRIFTILAEESKWEVRKCIAKQIGDICKLSGNKEGELFQIVNSLLECENINEILLDQFFIIAKSLKTHEKLLEILVKELCVNNSNWRKMVVVIKELLNFCLTFDCSNIHEKVALQVLEYIKIASKPVQIYSAKLLAEILYKNLSRREEFFGRVLQLANHRIGFIEFCTAMSTVCSHRLFCRHFMPSLIVLCKDPIKNVAYAFATHYVDFRLAITFDDSELKSEFRSILNYYLETDDKFLVQTSLASDEKLDKLYNDYYNSTAEIKENSKIKYETEMIAKESSEPKTQILKQTKPRKSTIAPRNSSHNPTKRHSLGEIDKTELNKVIQKVSNKRKVLK